MRPVGVETRGTTAHRRLRRADRWLLATHGALLRRPGLLVVDLGFGDRPVTTLELAHRLHRLNPTAGVVGLDISPDRVAAARVAAAGVEAAGRLEFDVGGFELGGRRPDVVRAFNVLRQYDADEVAGAWQQMTRQLRPGGLVLDGTCDETGRLAAWVTLDAAGPRSLTLALDATRDPAAVAARLPKVLIHRNVPGEPIHRLLTDLDIRWRTHAPTGVFGPRQRLAGAVRDLRDAGWPLLDGPARWRRGELTVAWRALTATNR